MFLPFVYQACCFISKALIELYDSNGNGKVSPAEFAETVAEAINADPALAFQAYQGLDLVRHSHMHFISNWVSNKKLFQFFHEILSKIGFQIVSMEYYPLFLSFFNLSIGFHLAKWETVSSFLIREICDKRHMEKF